LSGAVFLELALLPYTTSAAGFAVDAHAHVFERGLAMVAGRRHTPDYDAHLDDYLALLDTHGLTHGVLVQPSFLGTDNSYLLQALRANPQRLRGVVVVDPSVDEATLQAMADDGVVGVRLNLMGRPVPDLTAPEWRHFLQRVNDLGWHVEVHLPAGRLPNLLPGLLAAGCRVVVDHFGRFEPNRGMADEGFQYLLRKADSGQIWVKLSGAYRNWTVDDCELRPREAAWQLLEVYGAQRLMWGSDWPHTEHRHLSFTATREWLDGWIDDAAQRQTLVADTPLRLFQFEGG
jgi:predicted TIM-barrel fold metal-dependent hydrolase